MSQAGIQTTSRTRKRSSSSTNTNSCTSNISATNRCMRLRVGMGQPVPMLLLLLLPVLLLLLLFLVPKDGPHFDCSICSRTLRVITIVLGIAGPSYPPMGRSSLTQGNPGRHSCAHSSERAVHVGCVPRTWLLLVVALKPA